MAFKITTSYKVCLGLCVLCLFIGHYSGNCQPSEKPLVDNFKNKDQINTARINPTYEELIEIGNKVRAEYRAGNHILAIECARPVNNIEIERLDSLSAYKVAVIHIDIAKSYAYLTEYSLALWHYNISSKIFKFWKHEDYQTDVLSNIAYVYSLTGDFLKAFNLYFQVLERQKHQENPMFIEHTYVQIANLYLEGERYDLAPAYLDSALFHSLANENHETTSYIYTTWASFYVQKGNPTHAEEYYKMALSLMEEKQQYFQVIKCASLLAKHYIEQEDYSKSITISKKYLAMADSLNSDVVALDLANNLFVSYSSINMFKEAIIIEGHYRMLRDSLENVRNKNSLLLGELRQQAANEVEGLKQQEEISQQTIKIQNLLLTIAIIGIIFLIGVSVVIYRAFITNKRLSEINKKQSERLFQLDQAKSRFFANISHDLRTPLSLMMGSIEQVLGNKDVYLTDKADRQLKTGLTNGKRIIHLTNEINELIKLEDSKLVIKKDYVNLDDMLQLFVSMFHSMADMKGVKLSYSKTIFDEPAIANIDVNQFEKVLFNLMTNALKHTKKGDSVILTLAKTAAHDLELSVIDSGSGIPADNVPYIFERYYQAPNTTFKTQEGFGIGLALVKEIIDKHDFKISAKSKIDEGTQITIILPLETVSPDLVQKPHQLEYSDETRNLFQALDEVDEENAPVVQIDKSEAKISDKTVLVVEDHPEVRQYIIDIIDPYFKILTADNGKRALKVLQSKKSIDLIITDLMMPWFDGFQLLESLNQDENLSKIPVLVLSARTSEADKQRVLEQGVNDFLHKPFDTKELLARINNLIARKSKWDSKSSLFINDKQTLSDIETSLLEKVEQMVMDKIDDPNLSIGYLASEIAVSERKFFRMIKKLADTTPLEYIKEIKLQYAKKLITEKRISNSSEAAKHIGINNVSHFNNQFKSRFGKKPAELLEND